MNKKYIVRLSDEERALCQDIVKRLKGTSEKVKRAQILLKSDADGPGWSDEKIAEAYDCSVRTVENQLYEAFKSLGVANRRELAEILGSAEPSA